MRKRISSHGSSNSYFQNLNANYQTPRVQENQTSVKLKFMKKKTIRTKTIDCDVYLENKQSAPQFFFIWVLPSNNHLTQKSASFIVENRRNVNQNPSPTSSFPFLQTQPGCKCNMKKKGQSRSFFNGVVQVEKVKIPRAITEICKKRSLQKKNKRS